MGGEPGGKNVRIPFKTVSFVRYIVETASIPAVAHVASRKVWSVPSAAHNEPANALRDRRRNKSNVP